MYSNAAFYNLRRGNPFTAYGETFMVMVQTVVVVLMIWRYGEEKKGGRTNNVGVVCGAYLVYLFVVFYGESMYVCMCICMMNSLCSSLCCMLVSSL